MKAVSCSWLLGAVVWLLLPFFSCRCPQVAQVSTRIDTVVIERTDTLWTSVDGLVPSDSSQTIELNLLTFCDSLERGLVALPRVIHSGRPSPTGERRIINTLTIDTAGVLRSRCRENEFRIRLDSVASLLTTRDRTIHELQSTVTERKGYQFYKNGFWILLALIVFSVSLLILRK